MSGPDQAPGAALAHRWQGRADIVYVGDVQWLAVTRVPGCPPSVILLAETVGELDRKLAGQEENNGKGEIT